MTYLNLSNDDVKDLKDLLEYYKLMILDSEKVDHYEKGIVSGICGKILSEIETAEKREYENYIMRSTCRHCHRFDPEKLMVDSELQRELEKNNLPCPVDICTDCIEKMLSNEIKITIYGDGGLAFEHDRQDPTTHLHWLISQGYQVRY
jgi:hypothetical protein